MKSHPLKNERELRGWSQAKVAESVGTNVRTVIRWEQGQSVPYPYYREQLCSLFGKNARELGLLAQDEKAPGGHNGQAKTQDTDAQLITATPVGALFDPAISVATGGSSSLVGRESLLAQAVSNDPVAIRHKVIDMLYLLDGNGCIEQDLQQAASRKENTLDDNALAQVAAIPLLDCALTPNTVGYLSHIDHHLNALVQSPGVLREQVTLADSISTELNSINASLGQVHQDAMQLIAMDDAHLALTDGTGLRNDIGTLASIVLNGGIDPKTGKTEKGVSSIAASIQQLATMDVTHY